MNTRNSLEVFDKPGTVAGQSRRVILLGMALLATGSVVAGTPSFGGPTSVSTVLKENSRAKGPLIRWDGFDRSTKDYFDSKEEMRQSTGFTFGSDYSMMFQGLSESPGDEFAAGGAFRFMGHWDLVGRDSSETGSLIFKGENRHRLGTHLSPQGLGPEAGFAGLTAITFSDADWILTNLYWQQHLMDGKLSFLAGVLDTTDYVDVYSLADPWGGVSNLAFSTNPTIPVPNQGLGIAVQARLSDQLYVLGGVADANGDPSDPGEMWNSFFSTGETFQHIEFGWVDTWENRFEDNVHVTLWQSDERREAGVARGSGVAFSASHLFSDRWLPFFRAGFSNGGGGAFLESSVSLGTGLYFREKSDQLSVGLNWGRPSEKTFGPGLRDQYVLEVYYRCQLMRHLVVTPDFQLLINPALSPDTDLIAVIGLRAKLSF